MDMLEDVEIKKRLVAKGELYVKQQQAIVMSSVGNILRCRNEREPFETNILYCRWKADSCGKEIVSRMHIYL